MNKSYGLISIWQTKISLFDEKDFKNRKKGKFKLDLKYFRHAKERLPYKWDNGEPTLSSHFPEEFSNLFGPSRKNNQDLTQFHKDLHARHNMHMKKFFIY